mmetsp:Transcript_12327/g.22375  ORF Transcript_12327/g.22375 Transcript_12327/m.22375 type:complete len:445 (-) Transcript_12327:1253-2587(-)
MTRVVYFFSKNMTYGTYSTGGRQYGSFADPEQEYFFEDERVGPSGPMARILQSVAANPLNRSLGVLLVFAFMGFLTIFSDHARTPHTHVSTMQKNTQMRFLKTTNYGAVAEVGADDSKLIMYHWNNQNSPPEVVGTWVVPTELSKTVAASTRNIDVTKEVKRSLVRYLKEARSSAGTDVPVATTRLVGSASSFSPAVQQAIQQGVELAIMSAGYDHLKDWDKSIFGNERTEATAKIDEWKNKALQYTNKLKAEAKSYKTEAKIEMQNMVTRAEELFKEKKQDLKKEYMATRDEVRKQHEDDERKAEKLLQRAEQEMERKIRIAEQELDKSKRAAEEVFNRAERKAEDLERKAEREGDKIERQAEARLAKLERQLEKKGKRRTDDANSKSSEAATKETTHEVKHEETTPKKDEKEPALQHEPKSEDKTSAHKASTVKDKLREDDE